MLYCTNYGVTFTERYIAHCIMGKLRCNMERSVALWERNVTNVVSMQRHIKLLMICITVKPERNRKLCLKNCVIGLNLVLYIYEGGSI